MTHAFDTEPLHAFFSEVADLCGITLELVDDTRFPIHLSDKHHEGITKTQCDDIKQLIQSQVDLHDTQIAKIVPHKHTGKFLITLPSNTVKALSDVYALSCFMPVSETPSPDKKKNSPGK